MIITIDGTAGSGKTTAARELAQALGVAYLDTGAMYRALTLKALRRGVDMEDQSALEQVAARSDLQLRRRGKETAILLDGEDVTGAIRSAEVSDNSHYLASSPGVRSVLVGLQRRLGGELGSFVTEGRDQGSVVFPQADLKFFLDAAPEVRARRRQEEMKAAGENATYQEVLRSIQQRDERDRSRAVAPLVKPPGAIEIDTSEMTIDQKMAELLKHVEARL